MSIGLTEIYRSFSDPTRLRILNLLLQQPLCVCHIQEVLGLPQVNTSQHLAYLRKAGLVEFECVQTWKVYRINHSGGRNFHLNLKSFAECARTDPTFNADLSRLQKALKGSRSPICDEQTKPPELRRPRRTRLLSKSQ